MKDCCVIYNSRVVVSKKFSSRVVRVRKCNVCEGLIVTSENILPPKDAAEAKRLVEKIKAKEKQLRWEAKRSVAD